MTVVDPSKRVGRPLKFKTVEELQQKIDEYVKSCFDYKRDGWGKRIKDDEETAVQGKTVYLMQQVKPFTITGLAYFLETTRDTLMDYESGKYDDPEKTDEVNEQFSDTIKRCKMMIYSYAEEQLFVGKNPSGVIFNLVNNWDWHNTSEHVIKPSDDATPIKEKLKEIDDKLSMVANSQSAANAT